MYRSRVGYEACPKPNQREKNIETHMRVHKENIRNIMNRNIKATKYESLKLNRQKAKSIKAQRNTDIATSNRHLLQKMTKIITTTGTTSSLSSSLPNNTTSINKKSLNAKGRSIELDRISKANIKILSRMMNVKSEHDIKKLLDADVHHKKLLNRLRMVKYNPSDTPGSLSEVGRMGVESVVGSYTGSVVDSESDGNISIGNSSSIEVQSTRRRSSPNNYKRIKQNTVNELSLLAQAALLDDQDDDEDDDDPTTSEQLEVKLQTLLLKHNEVSNPVVRKMTKRLSGLDRSKGEHSLVSQSKVVNVLRTVEGSLKVGGFDTASQVKCKVAVTKKSHGRLRIQVIGDSEEHKINCWSDLQVSTARSLIDGNNKHLLTEAAHYSDDAAIRKELLELSWGLIDLAHVIFVAVDVDGERKEKLEVKFVEPYLLGVAAVASVNVVNALKEVLEEDEEEDDEKKEKEKVRKSISFDPTIGNSHSRPQTAEVLVEIKRAITKELLVLDPPTDNYTKQFIRFSIEINNNRRANVIDITATRVNGASGLGDLVQGTMKTSVKIPTLISVDLEMVESFVSGVVENISVKLVNLEMESDVGPKLVIYAFDK